MAKGFVPRLFPRDLTVGDSTEDIELFAPGYVEARPENSSTITPLTDESSTTYLDWRTLNKRNIPQSQGARLLLYPKVEGVHIRPYAGNGSFGPWIDVKVKDKPTPAKVLIVTPGPTDVGCVVTFLDALFGFYFDPRHDTVYLSSRTERTISITNASEDESYNIKAGGGEELSLGTWDLVVAGESILEILVLERKDWSITQESKKRAGSEDSSSSKKLKLSDSRGVLAEPSLSLTKNENSLVKLKQGMKVCVGPREMGYWLTRLDTIFEDAYCAVWRARHSSEPEIDIVVKVLKIHHHEGHWIAHYAKKWTQEYTIHSYFDHPSIIRLLGYDARFHSLYLENIDAKALSQLVTSDFKFTGSLGDAQRIMENLASALAHVHGKDIIHADIKPGNVLFSPYRGAVLTNFGLSFQEGNQDSSAGCGTPWYVPPEFAGNGGIGSPKADVWALGVVMLWLLKIMRLPETICKAWNLRHINPKGTSPEAHEAAKAAMLKWHRVIRTMRKAIVQQNTTKLAQLVVRTLHPEESDRIDAETLSQELRNLRLSPSKDSKTPKPAQQGVHGTASNPERATTVCTPTNASHLSSKKRDFDNGPGNRLPRM
ncbi:hypothetical protein NPX13_g2768 [Xylaria arbuscula]|uniref:Protein kinase domain-containing protein n=1 Tax=Xylaria arbuscula TaxID=114810 RepID=A0A9W8NJ60_9PEZI|nr:hypothetical protein NPX13_g2768 [Xylaria arbuscula]